MTQRQWILCTGDAICIAVLTLLGFATHGETGLSFLPRMGAFFLPLAISWFLLAPALGLFEHDTSSELKQLWRPALTAFFAAALAAVLRGLILNAPVIPIFAAVLAGTSALGMVIWRGLYLFLSRKKP
jgi:hypothetical protein